MASNDTENSAFRIARVETISYESIQTSDHEEVRRLFDACCKDGFFYLDMSGTERRIDEATRDIYILEENIFKLPDGELLQYDIDKLSSKKLNGFARKSFAVTTVSNIRKV